MHQIQREKRTTISEVIVRGKREILLSKINKIINNDLDIHIQAKTNDRKVRRFGDILAPLSRENKLKMRLQE